MMSRRDLLGGVLRGVSAAAVAPVAGPLASLSQNKGLLEPLGFQTFPREGLAPLELELESGQIPLDLNGTLYRNGPGHFSWDGDSLGHWFDGDGLIRAFTLKEGRATLAAKFVNTRKRQIELQQKRFVMSGFGTKAALDATIGHADDVNAANTAMLALDDDLWALWEAGSPISINPDGLKTRGVVTLAENLAHMPFSAHPKRDSKGTIWNFSLAFGSPYAFLWCLSPQGKVIKTGTIKLPCAAYIHDWVVTERSLILPLQPWVFQRQHPPFAESLAWQGDDSLKLLIISKGDFTEQRIAEMPARFFFHTAGATEDRDGNIRFDAAMAAAPTLDARTGRSIVQGAADYRPSPTLQCVHIDPQGRVRIETSGLPAEFPLPSDWSTGPASSFAVSHATNAAPRGYRFHQVMRWDWSLGKSDMFDFGTAMMVEEAMPVTANGRDWLLVPSLSHKDQASRLHIFAANHLADGPVAVLRSDIALPIGFHGTWVAA